jgi:hypothetical protein
MRTARAIHAKWLVRRLRSAEEIGGNYLFPTIVVTVTLLTETVTARFHKGRRHCLTEGHTIIIS